MRNYALYGADELGYLQVVNRGPADEDTFYYYVHHPPLIVWSATIFTEIFGGYADGRPYEAVVRLVSVYATMISIAAFYVIARRLFKHPRRALWTTALYAFTPMILYFGRMPNHEPLALGFILPFVAIYLNWMQNPTRNRWLAMAVLAALAMWSAWAAAFIFAGLGVATLITGNNMQRRQMVALGAVTAAFTVAIPGFYELQRSGSIEALQEAFSFRTSSQEFSRGSENFTLAEYLLQLTIHLLVRTSFAHVLLSVAGIILMLRQPPSQVRTVSLALLGGAAAYLLVFRNASFIHDYYKIYLLPSMTFAMSVAIVVGLRQRRKRRSLWRYATPFVVSLLLISTVTILNNWWQLQQSGVGTNTSDLVHVFSTYTVPDDLITTNVEFQNSAVEYYAFRNITWEQTPDAVLAQATGTTQRIIYLYCRGAEIPEGFEGATAEAVLADNCQLITLDTAG